MSMIPVLRRPSQEDFHEFEATLDYMVSSESAWATVWDPIKKSFPKKEYQWNSLNEKNIRLDIVAFTSHPNIWVMKTDQKFIILRYTDSQPWLHKNCL